MAVYEYDKIGVNQEALSMEIRSSGIPGYLGSEVNPGAPAGEQLLISFARDLGGADRNTLSGIVAAHPVMVGPGVRSDANPAKIEALYCGPPKPYWEINYITELSENGFQTRLHAERGVVLGELVSATWYKEPPKDEAGSPVPIEERTAFIEYGATYTRYPDGRAIYRTPKRRWALEDGSWGPWHEKPPKFYLENAISEELARRASNCLAAQNTAGLAALVTWRMSTGSTYGEAVLAALGNANDWYVWFQNHIRQFSVTNSRTFFDAIQALAEPDLQWAHDCEAWAIAQGAGYEPYRFISVVAAEVNLLEW